MRENIYTTSITGIDGSGKTTVVSEVASMLSGSYSVGVLASLREPSYVIRGKEKKLLFAEATSKVARLYEKGKDLNPLVLFVALLAYIALQGRMIEPYMVKENPDFLIRDRDRLIDPAVMVGFYGIKAMPRRVVFSIAEAIGGKSIVDDVILLNPDPQVAFQRVRRNIRDEHESIDNLQRMSNLYPGVIKSLVARGQIKTWTSIDSGSVPSECVCQTIYSRIEMGNKTKIRL